MKPATISRRPNHASPTAQTQNSPTRHIPPTHPTSWLLTALLCTGLLIPCCNASDRLNWPGRSGPALNGLIAPEDTPGLPVTWSEKTGENIA